MEPDYFDPINTKLHKGITLIEASAGTGKTYTVAMLVLRFVVERNIAIQNVLLVTFTKAATEELKDRVRTKLAEARRVLTGRKDDIDASVIVWMENLCIDPDLVKQRLDLALLDIDQAGIFTIHGFCQRVLSDHALESGQLFNAEMLSDLTDIKQACADDFWRRQIYPRSLWETAVLTANYKTPDILLASIDFVSGQVNVFPPVQSLDVALSHLHSVTEVATSIVDDCADALKNRFTDGKFKSSFTESFESHFGSLKDWLQGHTAQIPSAEAFALLTENGLKNALNGIKFKNNKTHTSEQRKAEYWAELNIDTTPFDDLSRAIKQIPLIMRRALLETLRLGLDKQLQQLNRLSFDSLISRLAEVLRGAEASQLIEELQQRFAVALIDEFQDTDDSQWTIFSRIFTAPSHYLYLIGDPKQAIYKFRGADIYAYLNAQKQAQHRFTLGKNWRSHPLLIDAVNVLFKKERAFMLEELKFNPVKPALSADEGVLCKAGKVIAPMMCWQLPESGSKNGYWRPGHAVLEISLAVVNEVADLLTEDYTLEPANRKLQPRDIAILVRTNSQARDFQDALRAVGVPSVLNSTESVFTSQEATDLYSLLQAVAHPGDSQLLKQALTLDWFALDGQALYQLVNNETALDACASRFLGYFLEWQQAGLMAMMRSLLMAEKIEITLSTSVTAERRLTNLHHLIELLQQAVIDNHLGINKTLDWLRLAISKANKNIGSTENQQLRLESDEDAVQIVTKHRSKGLEYNIVFCPCLWQRSPRLQSEKSLIQCHENGSMIADLGSEEFERRHAQALNEELAEDLRILYVAVTRAKYRCYLAWADARSEASENNSAMAWLLDFAGADFSRQQSILSGLKEQSKDAFEYRLLDVPGEINSSYQKTISTAKLQAKKRHRQLYTSWQMSSYTALSALTLHEVPELPEDKSGEQQANEPEIAEPVLPKGAHTGNVVHDLLENCAFIDLAERRDISVLREKACQRYDLKLTQPGVIEGLLQAVVTTPLSETDPMFCLMNIPEQQCLKEMPFYLSMQSMDASRINRILQDIPTYQSLNSKEMCGYLTGFIDLVCEYNGLFYVMDYKTNSLADYAHESLIQAMQDHNYGLQYWIYSLVLHLYLQKRKRNYRYDLHFGGVRYLFVRGMLPSQPMSGVYQARPDLKRLESLADVFGINPC
jgi:exodeoxyribonuclease V beta subunit